MDGNEKKRRNRKRSDRRIVWRQDNIGSVVGHTRLVAGFIGEVLLMKDDAMSEKMNDEYFERVYQNFDFIDGDYNILILDNDKVFVKIYEVFGEVKVDFNIAQLPGKPKEILSLPMDGWITDDGVLLKVTDPSVCEKIAEMLRAVLKDEEQPPEVKELLEAGVVKEVKKRSTKDRKPYVDGWEVQCHRGKTPMYSKVVKEVAELIASEGMEVSIDKITDIVFAAYAGEITRVTAKSHAYRYREVCLGDIGPLKLTRGVKAGLTRLGYSSEKAIYKEVVDAITEHPERMVELIATIERVQKSTARIYVSKYKKWISGHKPKQDSVEEAVPQSGESITDPDARESITLCYEPSEANKSPPLPTGESDTPLCYHNDTPIQNEILLEILKSPDSGKVFNIQNIFEKRYGNPLPRKEAYDYQDFINLISVDDVKKIYAKLPESFNISNVRAHISTRFGQTEKRAAVAKLAIAMLIALFNCEEVSEGSFRKEKGGGKRPLP